LRALIRRKRFDPAQGMHRRQKLAYFRLLEGTEWNTSPLFSALRLQAA
jgi:hypothetical protein